MMKWLKIISVIVLIIIAVPGFIIIAASLTDYKPNTILKVTPMKGSSGIINTDSIFTVCSWNLGYFGLGKDCDFFYDGGRMTRPEKIDYLKYSGYALDYLRHSIQADFYFFQEVDIKSRRSYYEDQAERLVGVLPGMESSFALNYSVFFVPMPFLNPLGKVKSGLLSFSAYPTVENTRYAFPGGYAWPVRLFMLDRCFLLSRLELPGGKDLVLINTHNEAFDDGSQRSQQMAVLKDLMLQEFGNGNYVIAGGDWNQNPVGFGDLAIGRLGDLAIWRFGDLDVGRVIEPVIEPDFLPAGWQWAFDPDTPSNRNVDQPYTRGQTPTTIIDFFVVSPNIAVESVTTEDLGFEWSDHHPVRMSFKLNE
jgi:endonuclease/exonuclease/phosphatase family metal-dependent hydrolase